MGSSDGKAFLRQRYRGPTRISALKRGDQGHKDNLDIDVLGKCAPPQIHERVARGPLLTTHRTGSLYRWIIAAESLGSNLRLNICGVRNENLFLDGDDSRLATRKPFPCDGAGADTSGVNSASVDTRPSTTLTRPVPVPLRTHAMGGKWVS